jgi:hypothetical protein
MTRKTLIFFIVSILLSVPSVCQDDTGARSSLKGIKAFTIHIDIAPNLERMVLSKKRVREIVEERLKSIGAKSLEDPLGIREDPRIWVRLEAVGDTGGLPLYAVHMFVYVDQPIVPVRDANIHCPGTTWSLSKTAVAGGDYLQRIEREVSTLLDGFVAAFMSANPASERK